MRLGGRRATQERRILATFPLRRLPNVGRTGAMIHPRLAPINQRNGGRTLSVGGDAVMGGEEPAPGQSRRPLPSCGPLEDRVQQGSQADAAAKELLLQYWQAGVEVGLPDLMAGRGLVTMLGGHPNRLLSPLNG